MPNFTRLMSIVVLGLYVLGSTQLVAFAQGETWCIRDAADGSGCEISRAADKTLTYRLPNGYSLTFTNLLDGNQRVRMFHNTNQLHEFIAGMPNVPLNTIQIPLTQPLSLYGVVTARPDGIFEVGVGTSRSFYIPVNGGIMLIPVGSQFITLWLLGGNSTREFEELSDKVRGRIERIEEFFEIDHSEERLPSNYFREAPSTFSFAGATMSFANSGNTPDCCCNGTGKKTLIRGLGGRGSEDGSQLQAAFNGLDEHDKECVEFETFPYDPDICAKDIGNALAADNFGDSLAGNWCKVVTAAHSQGGIPAAYAASGFPGVETHTHTMGSPLQGAYVGGTVSMGTLWTVGYFFPVPGGAFVMDLAADCMFSEVASSHQYQPIGPTSTFITHTHEPTGMFPLSTQQGGPAGSTAQHHPGTDHNSVVDAALESISSQNSCTKCGDGVVDGAEECEGEGSSCTTSGGAAGKCSSKCKCESLCDNGTLDPGEDCDSPGKDEICLCSFLGMHKVQCTLQCKIPGCDHPADPTPTPPQDASQKPSPSPSPSPSSTPVQVSVSDTVEADPTLRGSAPPLDVPGLHR